MVDPWIVLCRTCSDETGNGSRGGLDRDKLFHHYGWETSLICYSSKNEQSCKVADYSSSMWGCQHHLGGCSMKVQGRAAALSKQPQLVEAEPQAG